MMKKILLVIIVLHYYFEIRLFFLKTSKSGFSGNTLKCNIIQVKRMPSTTSTVLTCKIINCCKQRYVYTWKMSHFRCSQGYLRVIQHICSYTCFTNLLTHELKFFLIENYYFYQTHNHKLPVSYMMPNSLIQLILFF